MRERELKHHRCMRHRGHNMSLPMRERELKLVEAAKAAKEEGSLPMRERELKRDWRRGVF